MRIPVTGFTSWHWHLRLGYGSTRTVEIAALFAAPHLQRQPRGVNGGHSVHAVLDVLD